MGLPSAGVDLQAKGFDKYIRNLNEIDRKQQEVFNARFKGTGLSFQQVTKAARQYEKQIRDTEKAQKRAALEARKLAEAQKAAAAAQKAAVSASRIAFVTLGKDVARVISQLAKAAFELGKIGAQFRGQQTGLKNLAASFGQAGADIQNAIVRASKGTISGLEAINAANQGLLLGVAQTPAEFEKLTNSALTLGRAVGLSGPQAIEQFTTALGRQSLLILDNFGISAKQVRAEMERLAQVEFGKPVSQLSDAEKQANFMAAALKIAEESAAAIGDEAGEIQASFDRLTAASSNFQTELGAALAQLNQSLGITEAIAANINRASAGIKELRGGLENATIEEQIEATEIKIKRLEEAIEATNADLEETSDRFSLFSLFGLDALGDFFDEQALETQGAELAKLDAQLEELKLQKAAEDQELFDEKLRDTNDDLEEATQNLDAYKNALRQAESLQLSFAREAEDAARKLARSNEDLARKRARDEQKFNNRQQKDRDKLLADQTKRFDKFEADRKKQISKAEDDARKERQKASEKRKRDERKLFDELKRERDRFNLSQVQSERQFALQERRLIAEGDILAIQQLREDRALERQAEKENFEFGQKDREKAGKEQLKEDERVTNDRINELKSSLEEQRRELLASFDEQIEAQKAAQIEARNERLQAIQEQDEDRAIALAREEEDRRISQQRQLEDLGRSLADQEGVTEEGAAAIAEELEKVFGVEGVADNIFSGFKDRTESDFRDLFDNLENIVSDTKIEPPDTSIPVPSLPPAIPQIRRSNTESLPIFDDGGIVPGQIGSPQLVMAHGGETILPTHKRSMSMSAPVIPSQTLNVAMSGGFNITGSDQVSQQVIERAVSDMTENFRIAVNRIARKN